MAAGIAVSLALTAAAAARTTGASAEVLADGRLVILDVAGNSLSLEVRVGSLPDRKISKPSRTFLAYLDILKAERTFDR